MINKFFSIDRIYIISYFFVVLSVFLWKVTMAETIIDPTKPYHYHFSISDASAKDGLILTSIIFSKQRKLAMINEHLVHVGDSIGYVKILDIGKNTVTIEDKNERDKKYTLFLYEKPIKIKSLTE